MSGAGAPRYRAAGRLRRHRGLAGRGPLAPGSTFPGFRRRGGRVRGGELALAGGHRFSDYGARLPPRSARARGRTRLRAETRAELPGLARPRPTRRTGDPHPRPRPRRAPHRSTRRRAGRRGAEVGERLLAQPDRLARGRSRSAPEALVVEATYARRRLAAARPTSTPPQDERFEVLAGAMRRRGRRRRARARRGRRARDRPRPGPPDVESGRGPGPRPAGGRRRPGRTLEWFRTLDACSAPRGAVAEGREVDFAGPARGVPRCLQARASAEPRAPDAGLCDSCRHQRLVPNTRGSVFSLCERSRTGPRLPALPAGCRSGACPGHEPRR